VGHMSGRVVAVHGYLFSDCHKQTSEFIYSIYFSTSFCCCKYLFAFFCYFIYARRARFCAFDNIAAARGTFENAKTCGAAAAST
ncbi:MAG: hypothetical protein J6T77_05335, partial [Clostridia bacterium]|nr:hypothetical protein [Clostridia bacterium]